MSAETNEDQKSLRVLSLMEATTVTGPAKNLIAFCRSVRTLGGEAGARPPVEVSLVTFHRGHRGHRGALESDEAPNSFVESARASGVEVDVIGERFRFDTRVIGELRRVFERRRPDIIESHQIKSHFLVKLSGLWRRVPWVAVHHGYTTTDFKMELYNRVNRWSLPSAHRVVTVCGAFARQLTAREGVRAERIFVRHNSIESNGSAPHATPDTRALKERLGIPEGARVVVAVGRMSREKAHADLVRALGRLRAHDPALDFRLLVVGEGPERPNVEAAAREGGVADRLVFAGHVSDVAPFYAAADVMALPSHSEGSPNVLLEAMAAGVAVVATAVGGVPEIVAHEESALLVAPRDPEAMAAALGRLLRDEGLARRLAARASAVVAESYTPDAYARSLAGLYRELWRERGAGGLT